MYQAFPPRFCKWLKTGCLGTRLVSMYLPWLFVCMHSIARTFVHCCSMFMYLQVSCSNLVVLSLLIVISRDYRQKTDWSTDHFKSQLKGNFPSSWSFCTLSITVIDLLPYSYEWEGKVEEDTECWMVSESYLFKAEIIIISNTYMVLMNWQRICKTCSTLCTQWDYNYCGHYSCLQWK